MYRSRKTLAVAVAAALPWLGAHAQTTAELLKQIEALKAQLEALTAKVEAVSKQAEAVNPQEFNRLVQKVDLAEDNSIASGFKGLKFKGVIEAGYTYQPLATDNGTPSGARTSQQFRTGSGANGSAMFEVSKDLESGVNWLLRLTPGQDSSTLVQEASISVPVGTGGSRVFAGLLPDWQGYEAYFANQNPLISHNLLWQYAGPSSYEGVGMSHTFGKLTAKWAFANIDGQVSNKAPGIVYRADWTLSEYSYIGVSGANARTTLNYNLLAVDAGYTRGDWQLNGQLNYGNEADGAANGGKSEWWGLSTLAGYKLTPALQLLARFDYIYNRKNGGGIYAEGVPFSGNLISGFGPQLSSFGIATDPNRGANRYALSAGFNYSIADNTAWKTEVRLDGSTGYNFQEPNKLSFKKTSVSFGTGLVVSF